MAGARTVLVAGFSMANLGDLQPVMIRLAELDWRIDFVAGLELEEERAVSPPRGVTGHYFTSARQVVPTSPGLNPGALRVGRSRAAAHRCLIYDEDWTARVAPEITAIPAAASMLISASRPLVALLPETTDIARGRPWALALRALGLPTLVHWPGWYNLFAEYPAPMDHVAERYLVYSEQARRRLSSRGVPPDRVYPVGSPRFDAIPLRTEPHHGKTVLFVAQHREETAYYCQQLGAATADLGVPLVIKPHPLDPMPADNLARLAQLPPSVRIERERSLEELLAEAACVVTISSSAMFDAIFANIPVTALRYPLTLDELELGPGNACVRVARGLGELAGHLARHFDPQQGPILEQRRSFLSHHLGALDGRAVARVVSHIEALAGSVTAPIASG